MNDADFVDDRTGLFGFIGGQRGSEGTAWGVARKGLVSVIFHCQRGSWGPWGVRRLYINSLAQSLPTSPLIQDQKEILMKNHLQQNHSDMKLPEVIKVEIV